MSLANIDIRLAMPATVDDGEMRDGKT